MNCLWIGVNTRSSQSLIIFDRAYIVDSWTFCVLISLKMEERFLPSVTQIVTVGVRGSEPRGFKTGGITDDSISLSDAPHHGPDD